jgi:hypothetical protein
MITNRPLEQKDIPMLERALNQDTFEHCEPKQYTMDNAFSVVYEDEQGPIGVLRYTKTLRLVCVWCDNDDKKRNAAGAVQAVIDAVEQAKSNGFTDIVCETESPLLKKYYIERFGFVEAGRTLVLHV